MSAQHHAKPAPVGGSTFNAVTLISGILMLTMLAILAVRFLYGLGSVTNLNDGYPWGIWVVVDVVIGSAMGGRGVWGRGGGGVGKKSGE
jgi:Ni/Fe-hydrogenase subunit HybB-like protein